MLTKTLEGMKKKERTKLVKALNNDISSIDQARSTRNPAIISEKLKDISYISRLVDTWNVAQLNEALQMLDLPIIDSWNPTIIDEQRRLIASYLVEKTVTGNPITIKILGNLTPEVTGLKVTMNPIQDTSQGDPSPTNICPISGRDSVTVTRTAGEDVETHTHTYSSTVYGGVDDFVSGIGESKYGEYTLSGTENWSVAGSGTSIRASISVADKKTAGVGLCNCFKYGNAEHVGEFDCASIFIRFNISGIATTSAEFNTWISQQTESIKVVYELATPTTITNTPEDITLLKGVNVVSTDGDSIELKYKQNF